MKNLIFGLFCLSATCVSAANGDTTKVQTHNKVLIQTDPSKGSTNYAAWAKFPAFGKTYHKMYCDVTFNCPPGLMCGQWDYLNYIFMDKRKGHFNDTLNWEIMRLITPYGSQLASDWGHTWRFDITDFASLFADSIEIRYQHTGYEAKNDRGWLVTINFTMIEGPEIKPVKNISLLYRKSVPYGNDSLFDARIPEIEYTTGAETKSVRYKILQTGHGNDKPDGCGEFCAKTRYIVHDSAISDSRLIWRDDCGLNPVYPQNGTWIYDRANWCPGAEVREDNVDVEVSPNSKHSMDLDMESYSTSNGGGNYMITAYRLEFGEQTFQTDAAMWDIIRPSEDSAHRRENPMCGTVMIQVKNTGAKPIQSLKLEYGFRNYNKQQYWLAIAIKPGEIRNIEMPGMAVQPGDAKYFEVKILEVNDKAGDEYAANDIAWSKLHKDIPPILSDKILVFFRTNNAPTENSYAFYDAGGNIYRKKSGFKTANYIYRDTFDFYNGCFLFDFQDTGIPPAAYYLNKDGLGWNYNSYDGFGTVQLRDAYTGKIRKTFNTDFGTSTRFSFTVGYSVGSDDVQKETAGIKVYPNPANQSVFVDMDGSNVNPNHVATIVFYNVQGSIAKTVYLGSGFSLLQEINIAELPSGVYSVSMQNNSIIQKKKIIIQH